jgi:protease-4
MTEIPSQNPGASTSGLPEAPPPIPTVSPAQAAPPPPQAPAPPIYASLPVPPPRKRSTAAWVFAILFILSAVGNLVLLGIVVAVSLGSSFGNELSLAAAPAIQETITQSGDANQRIAVIQVRGIITGGVAANAFGSSSSTSDYAFLKLQVERALADHRVKVVVLAVDSPGGEASASDMMLHELKKLPKAGKKIIVHMGSLAASGGYYISMAGDKIIADPTCLTGSIGVIAEFFGVQGLLNDKLGVTVYTIKSGAMKDVGSPFRNMTAEESEYLRTTLIMPMFDRFKSLVREGRPKLSAEEVDSLADGRVFTASAAVKNGLIDRVGYMQEAIDAAAQAAGLTRPTVVQYGRQIGLFDAMGLSTQARSGSPLLSLSRQTLDELGTPKVELLWKIE